jgi:hypothetical protein
MSDQDSNWFKNLEGTPGQVRSQGSKPTLYEERNEDRMEQFRLVMNDMQKATQKAEAEVRKGIYAVSGADMEKHA